MSKEKIAVIDVGSSKITAMIAGSGIGKEAVVLSCADKPYSGFYGNEFYDDIEFEDALLSALSEAKGKFKIKKITIGVPNAFFKFSRRRFKINFDRQKKIKPKDIEVLLKTGEKDIEVAGYKLISAYPITFGVNGKRVFDPIGFHSDELGGYISYAFLNLSFMDGVKRVLSDKYEIKFVPTGLKEGEYFLGEQLKAAPAVIADVGYINSSFSLLYGGGVVADESVDAGGGFISAALMEKYGLTLELAEELKRKINLGLSEDAKSSYKLQTETGLLEFSVGEVNRVAKSVIDEAVGALDEFIEKNSQKFQGEIKLYLTGGGISRIRGAKSHVATRTGLDTEILVPQIPEYDKPERASLISLLAGEKCL